MPLLAFVDDFRQRIPFTDTVTLRLWAAALLALFSHVAGADEATMRRGQEVYAEKCASCHGVNGEGTPENYSQALFGDKSAVELSEVITATMPEGEPENCVGEEARAVAEWMRVAFYSPEAQARINPPQLQQSRLTVSQYRNTVADLAESYSWFNQPNDQEGLKGRYYKKRHFRQNEMAFERLDSRIDFNFGEGTPDAEKMPDAEQFSMLWDGSLLIDQTGWYDFVVKTENATRLFVNNNREPVIDAWVKSGDETEHSARLFLLSGRLYPIKLEWFTFKEPTASIGLWWTPPHGVSHPIPSYHLSPQGTHEVLVIQTPFPADDQSDGYIRGNSVSAEWHDATTFAAIETVDKLTLMLPELAKLEKKDDDAERRTKLKAFCQTFADRAFRRPVSEDIRRLYVDNQFQDGVATDDAVRRSLLAIMKSPRLLFLEVTPEEDLYTKASRLSFALLDSTPDKNLLQAAEKQWMKNQQAMRDQCWRMVNSYRGTVRIQEFLRSWLNLQRLEDVAKDGVAYPEFSAEIAADMRASLELLIRDVAKTEDGALDELLTSRETWLNDRLAAFYGVQDWPETESQFKKVAFETDRRAGVLTHPFMLSALAYQATSSPIHRGVFVSRGLLGRTLKPPPDSVSPVAPDLEPHLNTRERVAKQTSPSMCANCHGMINPLGFALEQFDAVGRWRQVEKGRPLDTSGHYRLQSGQTVQFAGATDLAEFLAESPETHRSFVRQLFHHMVQQPILAYGPDTIDRLAQFFADHNFNIRHLMVEIAMTAANFPTESPSPTSP